jgi:hypothetical protein
VIGVSTVVSDQVQRDPAYARQLQSSWRHVVVLERLARGGGAARWYFASDREHLAAILDQLQTSGGSCVSFYFDDQLLVEVDDENVRQRMFDAAAKDREIVIGYPAGSGLAISMELPTGTSELSEVLLRHPSGECVV